MFITMAYLRAVEVGRPPESVTYDLALKLQTNKDGAVLRDRIRLPFPCNSDYRIAVVCKEGSKVATEARADGAVAVGEASLFAAIKAGDINFNRLICHADSVSELMKAGLGPVLGPRGLMPSLKNKTITTDVRNQMRDIAGTEDYRERGGVVRMAIGQLSFTPQMIADNIKAMMGKVKEDIRKIEITTPKMVDEVVLSSTNGPGFSLSGAFSPTDEKITPAHLSTAV
ncbi:mitochondrial large ribosomal subunit [Niveomyces insectorum RCEF 264]|uniref:Mitochondrial large ribosomal subunit n=1 Tax=Niveomyces insectorum RCEF 264 TaxID=1081102 RepID=A0A167NG43_9HYPO|nr:mitochondrial large ribosomal subunit [Niveomyces insectorum RCEF 264]